MEENINYRSGLKNLKKKIYRWPLRDNTCSDDTPPDECHDDDQKPEDIIEHNETCYTAIKAQDKSRNAGNTTVGKTLYYDINKCIEDLSDQLRCNKTGDYFKCAIDFKGGPLYTPCNQSQDKALETIVDYCINHEHQPAGVCDKSYEGKYVKDIHQDEHISKINSKAYDISCPDDCNLNKLNKHTVHKYTYKNTLTSTPTNMNCNEMSKLIYNCDKLKDNNVDFDKYYKDFVKEGKFDYDSLIKNFVTDENIDKDELVDRLLKYSMCKIAADNIDIVKGAKIDQSLTEWWHYNIFNNYTYTDSKDDNKMHKSGFQRNIFYISFFIVLFLKLTILSKFNIMPGTTTYLNKVLPILTIIFSLVIFYGFINNYNWISTIARASFYLFISAIIFGIGFYIKDKIWSKDDSSKQVLAILLFIGCALLLTKGIWGISDNNTFISISILLYFIFISIFFILKSEKTTIIFKMLSILIICLLLVVYLFYTKDLLFNIIYFYIFVFIILIFIICANNTDLFGKKFNDDTSSKYVKIINVILRPFKSDNKMDSSDKISKFIILGLYTIFAFADSFISVLSPQMALVIMISFRLILNRWFEPVNAIFASLSGYSMSNVEGTYDRLTTTNRGVLDVDNLLGFFVK